MAATYLLFDENGNKTGKLFAWPEKVPDGMILSVQDSISLMTGNSAQFDTPYRLNDTEGKITAIDPHGLLLMDFFATDVQLNARGKNIKELKHVWDVLLSACGHAPQIVAAPVS